jgi:hypothetical protein
MTRALIDDHERRPHEIEPLFILSTPLFLLTVNAKELLLLSTMSSYQAPRRDGAYPNDPTHETPYDDGLYGNESDYFENSYNLDEHDPYRDDPTYFANSEPPPEDEHFASHSEFDDEYTYDQETDMDTRSHTEGGDESIPESASANTMDTATRRDFKYSTADVKRRGVCYKWCCICVLFLIFFAISTLISMLFQKLFFDNDEDPIAPDLAVRDANETFPRDKQFISQVCSMGTVDIDGGARCREDCLPQFFECCNPFNDLTAFNFSTFLGTTNSTLPPQEEPDDEVAALREGNCSLGSELRGCMAYSKCQAVSGIIDPAPASLPILCGDFGMERDPDSCEAACRQARCCFNEDGASCLADNLDICMDYSPCQNLRGRDNIVESASDTLDQACYWQLPECFEECQTAECCSDPNSRCYQENFMACLTYAPCNNVSEVTSIHVPEIYSRVPMPPVELVYACDDEQQVLDEDTLGSCAEYCEQASCCYELAPEANCFFEDPLGCLLWHQHCQVEAGLSQAWWTGQGV